MLDFLKYRYKVGSFVVTENGVMGKVIARKTKDYGLWAETKYALEIRGAQLDWVKEDEIAIQIKSEAERTLWLRILSKLKER